MTDSPHEYIEKLREENRALRRGVIELVREKQALEEVVTRQAMWIANVQLPRPARQLGELGED